MSNDCYQDGSLIFSKNTVDDGDIYNIEKDISTLECPSPCSLPESGSGLTVHSVLTELLSTPVFDAKEHGSMAAVVANVIDNGTETQSFLLCNLASVVRQLAVWKEELPMVDPFYAVKCNPDPVIVKLLASLGCSFDCATMGEIDMVSNHLGAHSLLPAGKTSAGIVYANPAKMEHMLEFAAAHGVQMTVFDGEDELYKIAKVAAAHGNYDFRLLLRITTDDKDSVCKFSKKFGCPYMEAYHLLTVAQSLGLHVAGVSFHVGSGCGDAAAYSTAMSHAAKIFSWAEELGMPPMDVVDIGGGFPGDTGGYGGPGLPTFQQIAAVVRTAVTEFCTETRRDQSTVRFIAEPGRYFVSASTMTATKVFSRKGGANGYQALYVDNGVYGSFNTVVYDHAHPIPKKLAVETSTEIGMTGAAMLRCSSTSSFTSTTSSDADDTEDPSEDSSVVTSTDSDSAAVSVTVMETSTVAVTSTATACIPTAIFGPTCDGLDQLCSMEDTLLQPCAVGDWLVWENQGAYTHTASFVFNGFTHVPNKIHCFLL